MPADRALSSRSFPGIGSQEVFGELPHVCCSPRCVHLHQFNFLFFFKFQKIFVFLGPHEWHMKVPRLGGPIRPLAYSTATATLSSSLLPSLLSPGKGSSGSDRLDWKEHGLQSWSDPVLQPDARTPSCVSSFKCPLSRCVQVGLNLTYTLILWRD